MSDKGTVLVAMSGGVDSSTTAYLLKEQGYSVIGITMRLYDDGEGDKDRPCCSTTMAARAAAVCRQIDVPHYVVDFREEFKREVVDNFVDQYLSGNTPNPCVRCNTYIKWAPLVKKKHALNADYIATGHYARVIRSAETGEAGLHRGIDAGKDQTYFLWGLTGEHLSFTLFPLGGMTKKDVRESARRFGLATAETPESMEICFVPDNDYRTFIGERLGKGDETGSSGEFRDTAGNILGKHSGFQNFTVGQRKKLGISVGRKIYVKEIIPEENAVVVADVHELDEVELEAHSVNWINGIPGEDSREVEAMIRYRDPGTTAVIEPVGSDRVLVRFREPVRAVTPGQSVVFYDGDRVVGGGVIAKSGVSGS